MDQLDAGAIDVVLLDMLLAVETGVALLNELNFTGVEPSDAAMILRESIVPNDSILDAIAKLRGDFDTAVEDYAQQLQEANLTLVAPAGEQITDASEDADARYRLSRYVCTSILVDDREEAQF